MKTLPIAALLAACLLTSIVANAETIDVSVLSLNVWVNETNPAVEAGIIDIINASGANIVGLQEMTNSVGISIASTLGWNYLSQSGSDEQIISSFPILGGSSSLWGGEIEISSGYSVYLFNAHLAAYPYQPYDLRDGIISTEAQAIAAAEATRGGQMNSMISDMSAAFASGQPIFTTGDFNEPSHLDWTAAAAAATARPYDLEVAWPASTKMVVNEGFTDSLRAVRPDPVTDTAYTWTPGYPPPSLDPNEVHDRIDFVYHRGADVTPLSAFTLGYDDTNPNTDIEVTGYVTDHRGVVANFTVEVGVITLGPADFDGDDDVDGADWLTYISGLGTSGPNPIGNMNSDNVNDHADFKLFKTAYENFNGLGSFNAMVASIPEPTSLTLLILGGMMLLRRRI